MKKLLLIATSALVALGAGAADFTPVKSEIQVKDTPKSILLQAAKPSMQKAPVKKGPTADGFELGFCGEMYSWYYAAKQNKTTYQLLKVIDGSIATALAGNKITDITFSATLTSATQKRNGQIFVAEISPEGELVMMATQTVQVTDSYQNKQTYDQTASFDEPYVIKADTPFAFGVSIDGCVYMAMGQNVTADYPIGVDGENANSFAGLVLLYTSKGEYMGGIDMGEDVGTNLYLKANTVGDKKSLENIYNIQGAMIDAFQLPIMVNGKEATAYIGVENLGTNELTSLKYTATVPGGATLTKTETISVASGDNELIQVALPALGTGKNTLALTIDEINAVPAGYTVNLPYLGLDGDGYARKFVVEEATGTWCGYCPMGIVGFEYMEENHADDFAGIAVHGDDDMEVASYLPWLETYISGFPQAVVNRDGYWADVYPEAEELESTYQYWQSQRSPVKVDVEAAYDEAAKTINANVFTEFALDYSGASVQLVLLQNDIPGVQNNYFSTGQYGECGGWESKGASVGWMYQHVARDLVTVENSLPASISKGVQNTTTVALPTTGVQVIDGVTGIDNTSVVALVIDDATGIILNAAKVSADKYGTSGVKDVLGKTNAVRTLKGAIEISGEYRDAAVYNMAGAQVAAFCGNTVKVPAGVYVVRVDGISHKVIVK